MHALFLLPLVQAHTPSTYDTSTCPGPIHLHDINVSQAHYMRLHPHCNVTIMAPAENCYINTLHLSRFQKRPVYDAWMEIDGQMYREPVAPLSVDGEPFTLTPGIKTIEFNNKKACTIKLGTKTATNVVFVNGKAEEWWLFLTIPIYGPWMQWGYAYPVGVWFWPLLIYASYAVLFSVNRGFNGTLVAPVATLVAFSIVADVLLPLSYCLSRTETWPHAAFWNIVLIAKTIAYCIIIYIVCVHETRPTAARWGACSLLGMLVLYLYTVGCGIGGYVLVPIIVHRYRFQHPGTRSLYVRCNTGLNA